MSNHKATPEQWDELEGWAGHGSTVACLLELRDRVMALEAQSNHIGDINKMVPPPAPVAGEVGELVADLRAMATHAGLACQPGDFKILTRAANMLQQIGEREAVQ
jgi:hypothetical protein